MSFGSPLSLLTLLAVPAILALVLAAGRRGSRYPVAFTNLEVLASVAGTRRRRWKRAIPLALLVLALALASVALARPRVERSAPAKRATVVLLVDVSGSMRASDVAPTRLGAAVAAMRVFLDKLPSPARVGIVTFSTEPQALLQPTADRAVADQAIDLLAPESGTAIGDGIAAGLHMLEQSLHAQGYVRSPGERVPGAIVLLSDGTQNQGRLAPLEAAREAKDAGVRIYPVSLGTPHGKLTFGVGPFAMTQPVPPDPSLMAAIARTTGGTSFTARDASTLAGIYQRLGSSVISVRGPAPVASWFAAAAAGFLLAAVAAGAAFGPRLP